MNSPYNFDWPDFDIDEWDEFGQNELTKAARDMVFGLIPYDTEVIWLLVHDAEYSHIRLNNAIRRFRRKIKKNKQSKGER